MKTLLTLFLLIPSLCFSNNINYKDWIIKNPNLLFIDKDQLTKKINNNAKTIFDNYSNKFIEESGKTQWGCRFSKYDIQDVAKLSFNPINNNNYLVGNQLTEADIRLVTTLLRFDNVYHYHFKCNLKRIADYKNLSKYLNQFRKLDCIKKTTFDDHIKRHYFFSHESINPTRVIPIGPIIS